MPTSSAAPSATPDEPVPANKKAQVIQGTSAGGARALGTQVAAFYFRAPIKAFFRMRVDYMQVARAINPAVAANAGWSFAQTTPGLLAHAIKTHGWGFLPRQVLPPMVANASIGAILYTTYLQALSALHEPSSHGQKRVYPPPPFAACFGAGFIAGAVQSVAAAPLDALVVRFKVSDMLEGGYKSIFAYSRHKLSEIGLRGVFAGYTLSLVKESMGYGLFFASFELVKQQAYFSYLTWYYGGRKLFSFGPPTQLKDGPHHRQVIRPHYTLEPIFLLLAGACASVTQQSVLHPLSKIQQVYYTQLESIDYVEKIKHHEKSTTDAYRHGYEKTYQQCKKQASKVGGWRRWLWRGLAINTLRQVPSTSAGLFVFEIFRRRMGEQSEEVAIEYEDTIILLR